MYLVKCNLCGAVYVSQTQRTLKSRFKEHIRHSDTKSFIYLLMSTYGNDIILVILNGKY